MRFSLNKLLEVVDERGCRVLGGHTHTFLHEPVHYKNTEGKDVMVAQVGWAGIRLGRIDYYFNVHSGKKESFGSSVKISEKTIAV